MKEFSDANFVEHPKFYPKLLHLFESCAPKSAVEDADKSHADLLKRVAALEKSLADVRTQVDTKINKLANPAGGARIKKKGGAKKNDDAMEEN